MFLQEPDHFFYTFFAALKEIPGIVEMKRCMNYLLFSSSKMSKSQFHFQWFDPHANSIGVEDLVAGTEFFNEKGVKFSTKISDKLLNPDALAMIHKHRGHTCYRTEFLYQDLGDLREIPVSPYRVVHPCGEDCSRE